VAKRILPVPTPLQDRELNELATFLDKHSSFDLPGALGLLHAVAIAPTPIHHTEWLAILQPEGKVPEDKALLLWRLHDEVVTGLEDGSLYMPDPESRAQCESFAAGFLAAAKTDAAWVAKPEHWKLASWAAFLTGKRDLVPPNTLLAAAGREEQVKANLYKDMAGLVATAYTTFAKTRAANEAKSQKAAADIGRNDPCPCGSGKKYKRCCLVAGA
jgi:uncharacterized protein